MHKEMRLVSQVMLVFSTTLLLIGCTGGASKIASGDDERDGRNFMAKPNYARLYIIQGYEKKTPSNGPVTIASGPSGSPQVAGAAAGLAIASLIGIPKNTDNLGIRDPTDPDNKSPHIFIPLPNEIFLNGKSVGTVSAGQYLALDVPPGHYDVKILADTTWHQPFAQESYDLALGSVTYLLTTEIEHTGTNERAIFRCNNECQEFINAGHRVMGK